MERHTSFVSSVLALALVSTSCESLRETSVALVERSERRLAVELDQRLDNALDRIDGTRASRRSSPDQEPPGPAESPAEEAAKVAGSG
ncbi:MAG: hypothetical protein JNM84_02085 [Planctomycetes bacterium]|nr:hypothetical protein [Planctomycetota bacterium]